MAAAAPLACAEVSSEQVRSAIASGVRYLTRAQQPSGRWADNHYEGGETCIITLALLQSGQRADSPRLSAALREIASLPNEFTYVVSLKAMVLAQASPIGYKQEIGECASWLVRAQQGGGLWSYTQLPLPFDHSNSQFALLGLSAAADSGVQIPAAVWQRARAAVLQTQNKDGGWSYRSGEASYGSMTAAGVSDLIIVGGSTASPQESQYRDGAAPNCGRYTASKPLLNAMTWLGRNFSGSTNPGRAGQYVYYWLYAVERCGILSGRRYFGNHDWYREGAEFLVKDQEPSGAWGNGLADTAMALLFLAKGHKPLLIQKLQWSADEAWNPDRNDVAHLIAFIGDKFGQPTEWQAVAFDAPMEEWMAAPLLYMQGHAFPDFSQQQRAKLRDYVDKGGTLLVEACCSKREFRVGFQKFLEQAYPGQSLRTLDAEHPVYHAHFDLAPYDLMGVDVGCRTSILFAPRDLSCLWEQARFPVLSEQAFKIGTNIAALALGRQALRDRLDAVSVPDDPQTEKSAEAVPRGLRLAQVVYDGDWRPDPLALAHFAEFLRDQAGVDVITAYKPVRLLERDLSTSPILFLTGHYRFSLTEAEHTALATYLRRGGFLLAEACCGRTEMDAAARATLEKTLPGVPLQRLATDHAVFVGRPGFPLPRVGYKPDALTDQPGRDTPELWGQYVDGRLAVVYSPFSLGCGLDGHQCRNCRGLVDADARRLAANIVLHALTH